MLKSIEKQKTAANSNTILYENDLWLLTVSRNMSFLHQCLSDEGHKLHLIDFGIDSSLNALSVILNGTDANIFRSNPNYTKYCKAVLESVNSIEKVDTLTKNYEQFAKQLEQSLDICLSDLNKDTLTNFFKAYQKFCAGLMITATIGRSGYELLVNKLSSLNITKDIDNLVATITYPKESTPLLNSQIELLEIAKDITTKKLDSKNTDLELNNWLLKYQHIPVNFCGEPWTIIDAKKQLSEILLKNPSNEFDRITTNHQNKISLRKTKLDEINNDEITTLSHAIARGTYLNEFRKNVFSKVSLMMRPILTKACTLSDSNNWRDCFYLTPTEVVSIISGNKLSLLDIKNNRTQVAILRNSSGSKIIEGDDAIFLANKTKEFLGLTQEVSISSNNKLKGICANRGIVKGIVKVILSDKDFPKFQQNEILVTTMTSVDFVPLMQKASAFITNEGGITSHASIVAREMNKPCIIGTKNATQILKDGDLVEVNANTGIITILKKAKYSKN